MAYQVLSWTSPKQYDICICHKRMMTRAQISPNVDPTLRYRNYLGILNCMIVCGSEMGIKT